MAHEKHYEVNRPSVYEPHQHKHHDGQNRRSEGHGHNGGSVFDEYNRHGHHGSHGSHGHHGHHGRHERDRYEGYRRHEAMMRRQAFSNVMKGGFLGALIAGPLGFLFGSAMAKSNQPTQFPPNGYEQYT